MASEETKPKQRSSAKVIYRFLGGAALGAFIVIIPISYGSSLELNFAQVTIASLMILSCGLLTSLWGEKFIDAVAQVLNSFAP
ncbi:hypothetical protein [Stenomitos frigidus]|uniref:Uncharacterized protein n=1 Tax=Stenomitos frigidus ULC18 TaxID=2107698 RepID=A0A2T1EJU6_9CYAN|nr:hypothetical protein [Stenomitos frigidus]PSB32948.1 hypothetical protein C7B82_04910 [Stenomitos frigidus ULC18]